jgi:membrane-bound serine protease (ClpP class)
MSFFIGATILFDSPLPGGRIPISTIITIIIAVLIFVFFVVRAVFKSHTSQVTTGTEGIIGKEGTALNDFTKKGKISVHGEIWNAESDSPVKEGDEIIVEEVLGMVLKVKIKNN